MYNQDMNTSDKAHKVLSKDPIMKNLIQMHGLPGWDYEGDLMYELIDAIIGQQLSVKAAATIRKRFYDLFGDTKPTATQIMEKEDDELRAVGFSYAKAKYVKDICRSVVEREVDFEKLRDLPDEEIIAELIKIKGVGRWTAEMFIMFSLGREDVFSLGDLGLRNAVARLYKVDRDDLKAIEKISLQWKPYRSLASRYLWKSLDNTPNE
jgi:DNA-3-methyladenine glycosylase II